MLDLNALVNSTGVIPKLRLAAAMKKEMGSVSPNLLDVAISTTKDIDAVIGSSSDRCHVSYKLADAERIVARFIELRDEQEKKKAEAKAQRAKPKKPAPAADLQALQAQVDDLEKVEEAVRNEVSRHSEMIVRLMLVVDHMVKKFDIDACAVVDAGCKALAAEKKAKAAH